MNLNELINKTIASIYEALNASQLPPEICSLILDKVSSDVKMQMMQMAQQTPPKEEETHD